jgi:hypothetical protein
MELYIFVGNLGIELGCGLEIICIYNEISLSAIVICLPVFNTTK